MKKYFSIILLIFLFILTSCGKQPEFYPERIEAKHSFMSEDFISFIILSTNLETDRGNIIPKYAMTSFMHIRKGINRKILYYQVDWITNDNTYEIYYRNELDVRTPARFIAQPFLPFVKMSGDGVDVVKAYYKYQSTINDISQIKEVKYQEEVFKFNEDDYINTSKQNEILNYNVYKFDFNDDKYHFKFQINYEIEKKPIHLDMQSWIKTSDNEVYSLTGLYNYATFSDDYISISDEIVDKVVEIEEIYMKIVYTFQEQTYNMTYVFNYDELGTLEI